MFSPGLEAPHPPEFPLGLPSYITPRLTRRFPAGWTITLQVADGSWWAMKDTRMLTHPTEAGLHALVVASDRSRGGR
jgi:hypothetical protein